MSFLPHFVFFAENKINYLFPIQSETFDYIYDGQDIIGQASKTRVVYVYKAFLLLKVFEYIKMHCMHFS